ncbi:hypothetical protein [Chryseobacterium vrystaatense]|uniref:Uncharacterized protein n=1 Tax=Chryseobacterium vrystaatense TaxID=307480 RepID=A0A1M5H347_9FLAO|nr:hypothetical protein [Chryseobacterium vrystaatense]SHG10326.1 hypothetical protein SAMN02787073_3560 [Chryseobacterium vrystaatense]
MEYIFGEQLKLGLDYKKISNTDTSDSLFGKERATFIKRLNPSLD